MGAEDNPKLPDKQRPTKEVVATKLLEAKTLYDQIVQIQKGLAGKAKHYDEQILLEDFLNILKGGRTTNQYTIDNLYKSYKE